MPGERYINVYTNVHIVVKYRTQMETKNLPIYQVRGVTPQTKERLYLGGCSLRSIKTVIISGLVSINGVTAKKKIVLLLFCTMILCYKIKQ